MTAPDALDLFQFHTPAVRHLAWLCHAPQLIQHTSIFEPARYLPDNYLVILQEWDKTPSAGPEVLCATPHHRLGYYVESLYACLITELLGGNRMIEKSRIFSALNQTFKTATDLLFTLAKKTK